MEKIKRINNGKLRLREMVKLCERRKVCKMNVKIIEENNNEEGDDN